MVGEKKKKSVKAPSADSLDYQDYKQNARFSRCKAHFLLKRRVSNKGGLPLTLFRMALHACTWPVTLLLCLPSPQMDFILSEIKHPLSLWASLLRWSVSSCGPTAPSQGGVKQNVSCGGLDWGGGDIRHLVVIKLVPTLFKGTLTVGCVMATIQTPIVVLWAKKGRSSHQNINNTDILYSSYS